MCKWNAVIITVIRIIFLKSHLIPWCFIINIKHALSLFWFACTSKSLLNGAFKAPMCYEKTSKLCDGKRLPLWINNRINKCFLSTSANNGKSKKHSWNILSNHQKVLLNSPSLSPFFRHAFPQHTWTPRVCTESSPWGAVLDNLPEPDRVKEGTSSTEQAALTGGERYMTRLELCCDLFTKLL